MFVLDASKLKEFADDNFKFDENGRKFVNELKTLWEKKEKLLSFSCSVFKGLVLQTPKNQGSSMYMPGVAQFFKTKLTLHKLLTCLTLLKMPAPTSTHSHMNTFTHEHMNTFTHSHIHSFIHLTNLTNLK